MAAGRGTLGYRISVPLCLGAVLNPVNSTMIATALTDIRTDFNASTASVLWLVSLMYLASAVGQPIAGQLADRVGPRKVFAGGMILVAAAGVLGAVAPNMALLYVSRLTVGLGTGAAYPAAVTMIEQQTRHAPGGARGSALGALMTVSLTALTVGPPLGGLLVETFGWQAVFAVNVPLALIPLVLTFLWLPKDENHPASRTRPDYVGMALFSLCVAGFLGVSMSVQDLGWYAVPAVLGATAVLIGYERRPEAPFIDVRLLARVPALSLTYLRLALTFTVIYGVMFGLGSWLIETRGLVPSTAGLLLLGMSGSAAVASAIAGRRRQVQIPLFVGTASMVAASILMLRTDSTTGIALLAGICALFGVPNGLNLVANQLTVVRAAPAGQIGVASGLFRTSQYLGAMCATGVISLCFTTQPSDAGLHRLAWTFLALSVVLMLGRVAHALLTLTRRPAQGP